MASTANVAEYAASAAASSPQKEYGYRNGQLLVTAELSRWLASSAECELDQCGGRDSVW